MGIQSKYGGVWKTTSGLGWANEYDRRVWKYDVDVAAAAAKAGFDEIQFDYVRFPTDGDIAAMVFPHKRAEPRSTTIFDFLSYAARRLHALHVRVSADVFGLSASRDLGIGQIPHRIGKVLDAIYPMVYPSHYNPGEYDLLDPEAFPYATVVHSLRDFNNQTRGEKVHIVPWLQDFTMKSSTVSSRWASRSTRPGRCTRRASCSGIPRACTPGRAPAPVALSREDPSLRSQFLYMPLKAGTPRGDTLSSCAPAPVCRADRRFRWCSPASSRTAAQRRRTTPGDGCLVVQGAYGQGDGDADPRASSSEDSCLGS